MTHVRHRFARTAAFLLLWAYVGSSVAAPPESTGRLELRIHDVASGQILPGRVHLSDSAGKPVRPKDLPFWHDHFVCDGRVELDLSPGRYTCVIEHGPEFRPAQTHFEIAAGRTFSHTAELARIAHMKEAGWWSGELHVHRPVEQVELLMSAEDLHVAPVMTWWHAGKWMVNDVPADALRRFDGQRWSFVRAGEDERDGGSLLFFHLREPLPLDEATYHHPPMTASIFAARRDPNAWIDIEKPFWWDLPIWLSTGHADSIGLANNHMNRSEMLDEEAWGRPRDMKAFPSPRGNGFYSQDLYYRILNAGFRIPPSAGSASGVLRNPVGYNRVYVHLGPAFDYQAWWAGLKAGRSFVTNGPLLRCRAAGEWPGHVFTAPAGRRVEVELEIELDSNDPVSTVEIVQNGTVRRVDWPAGRRKGSIGRVSFDASGWFLVRAVADVKETFRFASTAPYYVEIGGRPHISRAAVQFFVDWLAERRTQIRLKDANQQRETLRFIDDAERFWQNRLGEATAP